MVNGHCWGTSIEPRRAGDAANADVLAGANGGELTAPDRVVHVPACESQLRRCLGDREELLAAGTVGLSRDWRGRVDQLRPQRRAQPLERSDQCGEVLEGERPLWIVEGEKKSLAVAQLGLPAIGFCGVEGWHQRGSRMLLADLDAIRLRDRIVEVVPDGDYQDNPNVRRVITRLGDALAVRGARPRAVILPRELPDEARGEGGRGRLCRERPRE
jgi:hypothetical protein